MVEKISCLYCSSLSATTFRDVADIVRCNDCGVIYLRTRPTKETMYEIYQRYANDTSHMKPPASAAGAKQSGLRREYFVNESAGFLPRSTGQWLDIGCGWGALLNYARELGFTPRGIELTRNCLDFATMQYSIPVSNTQFTDSSVDIDSLDIVSMVHVFEHVADPKETLMKIFASLKPGGMFCGIVPNIYSLCAEQQGDGWVWLDPTHHYVHYDPVTLKTKLEAAGFVVERLYTAIGDFDRGIFMDYVKKIYGTGDQFYNPEEKAAALEEAGQGEEIRFFARKP